LIFDFSLIFIFHSSFFFLFIIFFSLPFIISFSFSLFHIVTIHYYWYFFFIDFLSLFSLLLFHFSFFFISGYFLMLLISYGCRFSDVYRLLIFACFHFQISFFDAFAITTAFFTLLLISCFSLRWLDFIAASQLRFLPFRLSFTPVFHYCFSAFRFSSPAYYCWFSFTIDCRHFAISFCFLPFHCIAYIIFVAISWHWFFITPFSFIISFIIDIFSHWLFSLLIISLFSFFIFITLLLVITTLSLLLHIFADASFITSLALFFIIFNINYFLLSLILVFIDTITIAAFLHCLLSFSFFIADIASLYFHCFITLFFVIFFIFSILAFIIIFIIFITTHYWLLLIAFTHIDIFIIDYFHIDFLIDCHFWNISFIALLFIADFFIFIICLVSYYFSSFIIILLYWYCFFSLLLLLIFFISHIFSDYYSSFAIALFTYFISIYYLLIGFSFRLITYILAIEPLLLLSFFKIIISHCHYF